MKISLAWLFNHIDASWQTVAIEELVEQLSLKVAEIDGYERIANESSSFVIAQVVKHDHNSTLLQSHELQQTVEVPYRKDIARNDWYLLKTTSSGHTWATLHDLNSSKEGMLPSLLIHNQKHAEIVKNNVDWVDYILEIDNTAVTNRPDLWGHRGWAREVACLLNLSLIPLENLIAQTPVKQYQWQAPATDTQPFTLEVSEAEAACGMPCRRFAGCFISSIEPQPSLLPMAVRLARLDTRPHNLIVDATNYVMFDLSQPMHAFDAHYIKTKNILARCAYTDEKITLLDSDEITLTPEDYVITNGEKTLALAGIMGGLHSGVTSQTCSLFLEAAHFDPVTIRRTSTRIKKRTEASRRFEKNLDPNQNTIALNRFIRLLETAQASFSAPKEISSLGPLADVTVIHLQHQLVTRILGSSIEPSRIFDILTKLDFGVIINEENGKAHYDVTVPTFRGTKDITRAEDLVEEICRTIGYETIVPVPAQRNTEAFSFHRITRLREIKRQLAYGMTMQEVQTYPFFDEEFIKKLTIDPKNAIEIANPQSQNQRRLVTSLVPHLIKAVVNNRTEQQSFGFFEYGPVWFIDRDRPVEQHECAGLFYYSKQACDFYAHKAMLDTFCQMLGVAVTWKKSNEELPVWYESTTAATLWHNDRPIGRAGMIAPSLMQTVGLGAEGFVFELDGTFLLDVKRSTPPYAQPSKYPTVSLDVSILVSLTKTADELRAAIATVDTRIRTVTIIDFYTKKEWDNKKSLTFRYLLVDSAKTLDSTEIATISEKVHNRLKALGAEIR